MPAMAHMAAKHHCIICQDLIHSGLYCSECFNQIYRSRSEDDEPLDQWLSNARSNRLRIGAVSISGYRKIDDYITA